MSLIVKRTRTGFEAVSLETAKDYLRVLHSLEDETIIMLITQAREQLEAATGLSLVEQKIELELSDFEGVFYFPHSPIIEMQSCTIDGENVLASVIGNRLRHNKKGLLKATYMAGGTRNGLTIAVIDLATHLFINRGSAGIDYPQCVKRWILQNQINMLS